MLYVIEIYERFGLCQKNIEAIVALPPNRTDISEYSILDDCDVEDCAFWTELDGIRLKNGDILIKKK